MLDVCIPTEGIAKCLVEVCDIDNSTPFLLIGNFNCILNTNERIGGSQRLNSYILNFQSFISNARLKEIPSKVCYFTWNNNQDPGRVWSKLDRAFYNYALFNMFPSAFVDVLPIFGSDNSPIVFKTTLLINSTVL